MSVDIHDVFMKRIKKIYEQIIHEWKRLPDPQDVHKSEEGAPLLFTYTMIQKKYPEYLKCKDPEERRVFLKQCQDFLENLRYYRDKVDIKKDASDDVAAQVALAPMLLPVIASRINDNNIIDTPSMHLLKTIKQSEPKSTEPPELPLTPHVPTTAGSPTHPYNELPHANDPAIYFRVKTGNTNGNPIELIKRLLDKAPPPW